MAKLNIFAFVMKKIKKCIH